MQEQRKVSDILNDSRLFTTTASSLWAPFGSTFLTIQSNSDIEPEIKISVKGKYREDTHFHFIRAYDAFYLTIEINGEEVLVRDLEDDSFKRGTVKDFINCKFGEYHSFTELMKQQLALNVDIEQLDEVMQLDSSLKLSQTSYGESVVENSKDAQDQAIDEQTNRQLSDALPFKELTKDEVQDVYSDDEPFTFTSEEPELTWWQKVINFFGGDESNREQYVRQVIEPFIEERKRKIQTEVAQFAKLFQAKTEGKELTESDERAFNLFEQNLCQLIAQCNDDREDYYIQLFSQTAREEYSLYVSELELYDLELDDEIFGKKQQRKKSTKQKPTYHTSIPRSSINIKSAIPAVLLAITGFSSVAAAATATGNGTFSNSPALLPYRSTGFGTCNTDFNYTYSPLSQFLEHLKLRQDSPKIRLSLTSMEFGNSSTNVLGGQELYPHPSSGEPNPFLDVCMVNRVDTCPVLQELEQSIKLEEIATRPIPREQTRSSASQPLEMHTEEKKVEPPIEREDKSSPSQVNMFEESSVSLPQPSDSEPHILDYTPIAEVSPSLEEANPFLPLEEDVCMVNGTDTCPVLQGLGQGVKVEEIATRPIPREQHTYLASQPLEKHVEEKRGELPIEREDKSLPPQVNMFEESSVSLPQPSDSQPHILDDNPIGKVSPSLDEANPFLLLGEGVCKGNRTDTCPVLQGLGQGAKEKTVARPLQIAQSQTDVRRDTEGPMPPEQPTFSASQPLEKHVEEKRRELPIEIEDESSLLPQTNFTGNLEIEEPESVSEVKLAATIVGVTGAIGLIAGVLNSCCTKSKKPERDKPRHVPVVEDVPIVEDATVVEKKHKASKTEHKSSKLAEPRHEPELKEKKHVQPTKAKDKSDTKSHGNSEKHSPASSELEDYDAISRDIIAKARVSEEDKKKEIRAKAKTIYGRTELYTETRTQGGDIECFESLENTTRRALVLAKIAQNGLELPISSRINQGEGTRIASGQSPETEREARTHVSCMPNEIRYPKGKENVEAPFACSSSLDRDGKTILKIDVLDPAIYKLNRTKKVRESFRLVLEEDQVFYDVLCQIQEVGLQQFVSQLEEDIKAPTR